MLVVLGFLLCVAAAVPIGMWRFDLLGSEAWPLTLGLFGAGMACFLAVRLQGDDEGRSGRAPRRPPAGAVPPGSALRRRAGPQRGPSR